MFFLDTFLFLVLFKSSLTSEISDGPRVVGGEICSPKKYPYMVSIVGVVNCGGSLVTLEWVLTAAHCIKTTELRDKEVMIRSGFQEQKHIQERYAILAVPHRRFNIHAMTSDAPELRFDIGMIKVDRPFVKDETTDVVRLPRKGFTEQCTKATVMGIGIEEIIPYGRMSSRPLKCLELKVVNSSVCSKTYPNSIIDTNIVCTLEDVEGKDACAGDSGGPLVCYDIIIGIVSYGLGCGNAGLAATYTAAEGYLTWIKNIMERNKHVKDEGSYPSKGCKMKRSYYLYIMIFVCFVLKQPF